MGTLRTLLLYDQDDMEVVRSIPEQADGVTSNVVTRMAASCCVHTLAADSRARASRAPASPTAYLHPIMQHHHFVHFVPNQALS